MNLRDWVAGERARERARGAELRLRETFPQTGPLGQAFPASPIVRSRRANVPPVNVTRTPPYGRAISVACTQTFVEAGTACNWSSPVANLRTAGFTAQTFPNTALTIPIKAYWRLEVTVAWDDHLQGGRVEVFRDGVRLWSDQSPYGASFDRTFNLGVCFPDEDIIVEVSPVGGAGAAPGSKQATVVASLVLVELPVTVATDPTGFVGALGMRRDTAGTHNLPIPPGTSEGDVMVMTMQSQSGVFSTPSFTVPGFTELFTNVSLRDSGQRIRQSVYWKQLTSSDITAGTVEWQVSATSPNTSVAGWTFTGFTSVAASTINSGVTGAETYGPFTLSDLNFVIGHAQTGATMTTAQVSMTMTAPATDPTEQIGPGTDDWPGNGGSMQPVAYLWTPDADTVTYTLAGGTASFMSVLLRLS